MVKILAIGDPHGELSKIKKIPIKDVDLILLTGDLGSASLMRKMAFENIKRKKQGLPERKYLPKQEKKAFMEAYISTMKIVRYLSKIALIYIIYGNVESSNAETKRISKEIGLKLSFLTDELKKIKNIKIINNKKLNFYGLKIGGLKYFVDTSWIKESKPFDYIEILKKAKKETDKAKRILKNFGNVDVLVCHQPPYGVLDKVSSRYNPPKNWIGKHAGSKVILDYIKKYKPKYVFCGHIHEGKGMKKIGRTEVYNLGVASYKIVEIN